MRARPGKAIGDALDLLKKQFDGSGVTKELLSNQNPFPVTGSEIINAFQVRGLATAATGAVVGAGYGALSGGSMIEGAKQGAFYGGTWGTFSHMNARRALAARSIGVQPRGFGGGFRAMAEIRGMPLNARADMAQRAQAAFRQQVSEARSLLSQIESGSLSRREARDAIGRLQTMTSSLSQYAQTPEAQRAFRSRVEEGINRLAEQLR